MQPALTIALAALGAAAYLALGLLVDRLLDRVVGYGDGFVFDRAVNVVTWPMVLTSLLGLFLIYVACVASSRLATAPAAAGPRRCVRARVRRFWAGKEKS